MRYPESVRRRLQENDAEELRTKVAWAVVTASLALAELSQIGHASEAADFAAEISREFGSLNGKLRIKALGDA